MAAEQGLKVNIFKVLDPAFCVKCKCQFAYLANVRMKNGRRTKMLYCARLDCDNWQSEKETQCESSSK